MNEALENQILQLLGSEISFQRGFSLLVQNSQQKLYTFILGMVNHHDDADEILQLTYIKVFKGFGSFKGESKFMTWIYKIASNETYSYLKSKNRRKWEDLEQSNYSPLASENIDGSKIIQLLDQAIGKLPNKQKQIFLMRYEADLSYQEISGITGTSIGALKASYHHAVKKIEEEIKNTI
jgi:RNA polymerase sigma-70 factor (ECF subfamily)